MPSRAQGAACLRPFLMLGWALGRPWPPPAPKSSLSFQPFSQGRHWGGLHCPPRPCHSGPSEVLSVSAAASGPRGHPLHGTSQGQCPAQKMNHPWSRGGLGLQSPSPPGQRWPPLLANPAQERREGARGQRGLGGRAPTHLLHTMAMMTTAMRKTRPAAEEPMTRGSFSWMLVWYSAARKHRASQPGES